MTTKLLFFLTVLSLVGCSKDNATNNDPLAQLPAETQVGANTFGCVINNQVFYPRDGRYGGFPSGSIHKAITFWDSGIYTSWVWNEIEVGNYNNSKPISSMIVHLQNLNTIGVGNYLWGIATFQNSIDGPMYNYFYCRVFNSTTNTYDNYGSYDNSGKVTITRYDLPNRIVSGTFSGMLKIQNGTQLLEIQNGRFDLKWSTLDSTPFP